MKYSTQTDYWLKKEFEALYREVDDPWGCSRSVLRLNNQIYLSMIFEEKKYNSILDIGCGLGDLSNELHLRNRLGRLIGVDVSETAVEKARERFTSKNLRFDTFDLNEDDPASLGYFDLISMSEVMWYLNDYGSVFEKLHGALLPGGMLAIQQYFPSEQKYYRDKMEGLGGYYKMIYQQPFTIYREVHSIFNHDGVVLITLLQRREKCQTH